MLLDLDDIVVRHNKIFCRTRRCKQCTSILRTEKRVQADKLVDLATLSSQPFIF